MNYINEIHLKETESTNTYAKALLKAGEPLMPYTLILTESQTTGRGRLGRSWESTKGESLCMSLITPHPNNPCITLIAALGVYRTLKEYCENLLIKWPNDLIAGNKKLCGILTESTESAAVIGIGINLNNILFAEEIKHKATSLKLLTNKDYSPKEIATKTAENIRLLLENSQGKLNEELLHEYTSVCANIGKEVRFQDKTGVVTHIGKDGSLIVKTEDTTESVSSGEVIVSGIY